MAGTDIQSIETDDSFRAYVTNWRATSFGLVDSRLPADFAKVHVSGSTNVPHDDLSCRGTLIDLICHYCAQKLPKHSGTNVTNTFDFYSSGAPSSQQHSLPPLWIKRRMLSGPLLPRVTRLQSGYGRIH